MTETIDIKVGKIEERLKNNCNKQDEILEQVKYTNGKVRGLLLWRNGVTAVLSFLLVLVGWFGKDVYNGLKSSMSVEASEQAHQELQEYIPTLELIMADIARKAAEEVIADFEEKYNFNNNK